MAFRPAYSYNRFVATIRALQWHVADSMRVSRFLNRARDALHRSFCRPTLIMLYRLIGGQQPDFLDTGMYSLRT